MSFQPVIDIVSVPRDSKWLIIKDATQPYNSTTNPTGWGAPGGPSSLSDLTSVLVQMQYFGQSPEVLPLTTLTGNLTSGLKATYTMSDGVYLVHALYGVPITTDYTILGNVITVPVTGNTFDLQWGNISYISDQNDPNVVYMIRSVDRDAGTIELYRDAVLPFSGIIKYYDAFTRILVLNCGEGTLVKDIASMAISQTGCNKSAVETLTERLLRKMAAQIAFNCGNYSRAHNAAVLNCNTSPYFKPCTSCN